MIKDKNSLNEVYKNYAFVEFFELENAKKALQAINKGEISLRDEILSGNYSTKTEDKNNNEHNNFNNNYHVSKYLFLFYKLFLNH
jgi:RNA recognition motif-containing protein